MAARQVSLGAITFANDAPFVLIGGVNVLESQQFALDAAAQYAEVCRKLSIPLRSRPPLTRPTAPRSIPSVAPD